MYFSAVGKIGRVLGAGALIFALSAAVVWPIWSLATRARGLYTALVGLVVLLLAAWAIVRHIRRWGRRVGAAGRRAGTR
jgi:RsiW-degrading membrane proteinase PrsW (M82 family)